MGVDGGAALIPENHRQGRGLLQQHLHGLCLLGARPQSAVHIYGMAQDQFLRAVFLGQGRHLLHHHLLAAAVDDGGEPGQQAGGVGNGDAGVGVAVVDCHNAHSVTPYDRGMNCSSTG